MVIGVVTEAGTVVVLSDRFRALDGTAVETRSFATSLQQIFVCDDFEFPARHSVQVASKTLPT